jgi:hypothetical protein
MTPRSMNRSALILITFPILSVLELHYVHLVTLNWVLRKQVGMCSGLICLWIGTHSTHL